MGRGVAFIYKLKKSFEYIMGILHAFGIGFGIVPHDTQKDKQCIYRSHNGVVS
jgi:hypothetical protein